MEGGEKVTLSSPISGLDKGVHLIIHANSFKLTQKLKNQIWLWKGEL
jgi:hypothetical protein